MDPGSLSSIGFHPDLGAFPVLRLDQISRIDTGLLQRSQDEALQLIHDLNSENVTPPKLVLYLRKQMDNVAKELSLRESEQRISTILSNRQTTDDTNSTTSKDANENANAQENLSSLPSEGKLNLIPLPSQNFIPLPSQNSSSSSSFSGSSSSRVPAVPTVPTKSQTKTKSAEESETVETHEAASVPSSRGAHGGVRIDQPSKKSLEVVYQNFGSQFVVAATEKRKRFYPKKTAPMDIETQKESEKLERCVRV